MKITSDLERSTKSVSPCFFVASFNVGSRRSILSPIGCWVTKDNALNGPTSLSYDTNTKDKRHPSITNTRQCKKYDFIRYA
jgi:hypothetical protein